MSGWWLNPTPLKNMSESQLGLFFPTSGKIKFMFQATNQRLLVYKAL